jgi:hypothetical protein
MACSNCGADVGVKGVIRIVGEGAELHGRLVRRCRSCNLEESSEALPQEWVDILVDRPPTPFAHATG